MATKRNKKTKVFFAHSGGPQYGPGKGSYDLVNYLKSKLPEGFQVLFPVIEKPNSPTYGRFKEMYKSIFAKINEPVILIGHSLGGSTLLKYLSEEKPGVAVLGLFLVSTPYWKSNMKEFQLKENFQVSLKGISKVFLYHSTNDTVVPVEHLEFYENAFQTAVVRKLQGAEHTFSNGLPELVSDIKSL
ncbi:serine hydrolase family protein [Pedobacter sp. HMF7647]|uniref:Serine hydrolase family protein n=1 Tax=Hufsiella arboris TaxID=2695275 RepID=A0A7K1Y6S8_9SPHI|nr:alpha/beta hydrolase [Hufsiella arboris]MXV50121.1 serine hydrolase family protein [Hufsiella arboris]